MGETDVRLALRKELVDRRIQMQEKIKRLRLWISELDALIDDIDARTPLHEGVAPAQKRIVKSRGSIIDIVREVFQRRANTTLTVTEVWEEAKLLGAQSDAISPNTVVSSSIRRLMMEHSELERVGSRGAYIWRSADDTPDKEENSAAMSEG